MDRGIPYEGESRTGFGPVRLRFLAPDGRVAGWEVAPYLVHRHIPGSARHDTQNMGTGMARVTWRAALASGADLPALYALLGTTQALVVWHATQALVGVQGTIHGKAYDELPGVLLEGISGVTIEPDGYTEVDVTFSRAVNLATMGNTV